MAKLCGHTMRNKIRIRDTNFSQQKYDNHNNLVSSVNVNVNVNNQSERMFIENIFSMGLCSAFVVVIKSILYCNKTTENDKKIVWKSNGFLFPCIITKEYIPKSLCILSLYYKTDIKKGGIQIGTSIYFIQKRRDQEIGI